MPRKRPHDRLDRIADSATEVFVSEGFAGASIAQISLRAKVSPGTIYLYAAGKDALFDLAIRRALEDPTVWTIALPHPSPAPGQVAEAAWRCIQNAAHFPRLWLAADSPPPEDLRGEVTGIVNELYTWLHRYRRAIKLAERSAREWPDVAQVFHRRFWRGGIRRVADYLGRRAQEGLLPKRRDTSASAHLLVEALAWMAVHRHWSSEGAELTETTSSETAQAMMVAAIMG